MEKAIIRLCLFLLPVVLFCGCDDRPKLSIYTWGDYFSPKVIKSFEEKYGCCIVQSYYDSSEVFYSKLKNGATGYDLLIASYDYIELLKQDQLLQKVDELKIPNVKENFDSRFSNQMLDSTFTYKVPYTISYGIFLCATDKVPKGVDATSWSIFENPTIAKRGTLLDDYREVIGAALMANGYSVSSTNVVEIEKAVETIKKWRKNIRAFVGDGYNYDMYQGKSHLAQGYSADCMQVVLGNKELKLKPKNNVVMVYPKEGFTISTDEFAIFKDAKALDLAYAFINYLYEPEVAKVNMEFILAAMPVKPAIELLSDEYRNALIPSDEVIARGQIICPLDDKTRKIYEDAWDKIR